MNAMEFLVMIGPRHAYLIAESYSHPESDFKYITVDEKLGKFSGHAENVPGSFHVDELKRALDFYWNSKGYIKN